MSFLYRYIWKGPVIYILFGIYIIITPFLLQIGINLRDEAWYLLILENSAPAIHWAWWHEIFAFLRNENLWTIRMVTFCMVTLSTFIFGYHVYYLIDKDNIRDRIKMGLLISMSTFLLTNLVCIVPYYITSSLIFVPLALAVFLRINLLSGRSNSFQYALCVILLGFFITLEPFLNPSNIIYSLTFLLILFWMFKTNWLRYVYLFVGAFACMVFMNFLIPYTRFINDFKLTLMAVKYHDHGMQTTLDWLLKIPNHYFWNIKSPFLLGISILIITKVSLKLETDYKKIIYGIFVLCILICIVFVTYSQFYTLYGIFSGSIFYLLLATFIYFEAISGKINNFLLITSNKIGLFLFVIPFLLSIGTDVAFEFRIPSYFILFLAGTILILNSSDSINNKAITFRFLDIFALILCLNFVVGFYKTNWCGFSFFNSRIALNTARGRIFVEPRVYQKYESFNVLMKNNKKTLVLSHQQILGDVYLSGIKLSYLDFRFNLNLLKLCKGDMEKSSFLESKNHPFPSKFWSVTETEVKKLKSSTNGDYILYSRD